MTALWLILLVPAWAALVALILAWFRAASQRR